MSVSLCAKGILELSSMMNPSLECGAHNPDQVQSNQNFLQIQTQLMFEHMLH